MEITSDRRASWLDRPLTSLVALNWETALFSVILVVAIFTRFFILENRVMSHDETSHVYFSWMFNQGRGYLHDPVTHGPFQFHIIALSYFLFGDNDFTARIPVVLFSIATVAFTWFYRRYLGRAGALVAALLMTISPYMLFYGRYVRNEAYVALFGVVMLWAILRYIETGQARFLLFLTTSTAMHFITKETAYIYTAQALLFLGFYFIYRITQNEWERAGDRNNFLLSLMAALLLLVAAMWARASAPAEAVEQAVSTGGALPGWLAPLLVVLALAALGAAFYFLIRGYGLDRIRAERSFDLLMLLGTLVLPLLAAFPLVWLGWEPPTSMSALTSLLDQPAQIFKIVVVVIVTFALAFGLGWWWNFRQWLYNFILFYALFTIFYTTIFTNGGGFFTGLVGGLGYWLAQQEVERGAQPWYYYALIQVPLYEYLPLFGSLLAGVLYALGHRPPAENPQIERLESETDQTPPALVTVPERPPVFALLAFWSVTSLVAYTIAGEKMPWLTVHITLPMILLAGWGIGQLVELIDPAIFRTYRGYLAVGLLGVFVASLSVAIGSLLGVNPPFQGKELIQLQATSTFLIALLAMIVSAGGLLTSLLGWKLNQISRVFALTVFAFLAMLTARTAFTASFINYDNANELLVYAHAGPGVKIAMEQIEELSLRTTDGLDLVVAYDDESSYPYWWYLRNYPNQRFYGSAVTRDLRAVPAILVGISHYADIESVVGDDFVKFEYHRMWWPNQDYYYLTWERIAYAFQNAEMRAALFDIWLNRDYTRFGQVTGKVKETHLPTWSPAQSFRLYLRKDVAAQLWSYGAGGAAGEAILEDPYQDKAIELAANLVIGQPGTGPGQFASPRSLAVAPDGSIYVADSGNHRIQHLSADGEVLEIWGTFGASEGAVQPGGGAFNEPWGIAVGPDGMVYVADTWNHRIQKFTPEGEFVTSWGSYGQGESPFLLWGPRDVAVSAANQVFVTDTGNKRILVYDSNGNFIAQVGSAGFGPAQFDEPVGVAVDTSGQVYVADTWNQAVKVMAPSSQGLFIPVRNWDVYGWFGQSWDNKPYISVAPAGDVFISDPEGARIIQFSAAGEVVRTWGNLGTGLSSFGRFINGLEVGPDGSVWVVDSANSRLLHFILP